MTDSAATRAQDDPFRVLLRRSLVPSLVTGLVCAVVAGVWLGAGAGLSAALGAAIVVLFFGARLVVMGRTARSNPQLVLVVALAVYTVKVVLLGVAMVVLTRLPGIDPRPLGITVLVTAVVWLAAEMRGFVRLRIPVFAAPGDGAAPRTSGSEG